ncbi:hypothetical protein CDL15_Pgr025474 [Punica granatum]|nr:hypothetical protein CDL15_Pgr025474 [Punica granatum]
MLMTALLVSSTAIPVCAAIKWTMKSCMEECMPICMRIHDARVQACKGRCTHEGQQLQGKGLNVVVAIQ